MLALHIMQPLHARHSNAKTPEFFKNPEFFSKLIKTGADCVTRTRDPRITNALLYQLS